MRSFKDFKAFWSFMVSPKNLLLMPMIVLLLTIGVFIIIAQSSAVAPLIYTLF